MKPLNQNLTQRLWFFPLLLVLVGHASAADTPWWASETLEVTRTVVTGVTYERVHCETQAGEPVRAHILSVTGIGSAYRFNVMGAFGALIPPSVFSRQSEALAVINGGFFSFDHYEGIGLIAYRKRVLYPPTRNRKWCGTVGFHAGGALIDWVTPKDVGDSRITLSEGGWDACHAAMAAGPILVREGKNYIETDGQQFNQTVKAPRTAIGVTATGAVLLVVVDGRQPLWSRGVTLVELADLFVSRHATAALNLDGGGSSLMMVHDKVVNRPSDNALPGMSGRALAVANVIGLFQQ